MSGRFVFVFAVLPALIEAGGAIAAPPPGLPLVVSGCVLGAGVSTQPTSQPSVPLVFRYRAVWSDVSAGYLFVAPGRPVGWEVIAVDGAGLATLGDATADWSLGPVGQPLVDVASGFSFVPDELDMGYSSDPRQIAYWVGVGGCLAFGLDLVGVLLNFGFGEFFRAGRQTLSPGRRGH